MDALPLAFAVCLFSADGYAADCPGAHVERVYVRGISMVGLFEPETPLLAEYGYYTCHDVTRGDTALIRRPGREDPIVKSVLVLPGDVMRLVGAGSGASLWVNGQVLQSAKRGPYRFSGRAYRMIRLYVDSFKGVMPKDTYFVFGTDPGGSLDSTQFGPVTRAMLVARVQRSP